MYRAAYRQITAAVGVPGTNDVSSPAASGLTTHNAAVLLLS